MSDLKEESSNGKPRFKKEKKKEAMENHNKALLLNSGGKLSPKKIFCGFLLQGQGISIILIWCYLLIIPQLPGYGKKLWKFWRWSPKVLADPFQSPPLSMFGVILGYPPFLYLRLCLTLPLFYCQTLWLLTWLNLFPKLGNLTSSSKSLMTLQQPTSSTSTFPEIPPSQRLVLGSKPIWSLLC